MPINAASPSQSQPFSCSQPRPAQAAIAVVNTNDSGPGSLRQALIEAPPGETIALPAGTYTLTSARWRSPSP